MVSPKVLVGCPTADTHDYCLKEYAEAIKNLSYPNYDILIVDNSEGMGYSEKIKIIGLQVIKDEHVKDVKKRIVHSRNIIRQKVLDGGYDYFLSLEQDVIPPKNVIEQLIKCNKKIITGVYFNYLKRGGEKRLIPLLWVKDKNKPTELVLVKNDIVAGNHLIEINLCGVGCMLIHRDVLKKIKFRFGEHPGGVDDVFFCLDTQKEGFKIFCNTAVKCQHLIAKKPWKWEDMLKKGEF